LSKCRQIKKKNKTTVNIYDYIIGQTPDFKHLRPRAFEIIAFIDAIQAFPNYHLHEWIAIDDTNLCAPCNTKDIKQYMKQHFVRCNSEIGITEEIADTIIAKFNHESENCCLCHTA